MNKSKKLVFSFYITNDFSEQEINRVHFECLRKHNKIFDDCIICFILENGIDESKITNAKKIFIEIFQNAKNITFKQYENTEYRESLVFKKEVYDNIANDDLVFFCHNKGITNVNKYDIDVIEKWVVGMYYYNLNFMDEVYNDLYNRKYISYGSFLTDNSSFETHGMTKYGWYYIGTFFWINAKKLYNYIKYNEIFVPELSDRFYDEDFLGNIFQKDLLASSHNRAYLVNATDFYQYSYEYIKMIYNQDEFDKEFYSVISKVRNKCIQVFYIATNDYINYIYTFLDTIPNFIPGKTKKITILTNRNIEKIDQYLDGDICDIEIIKIPDLIYPTMNINKTYLIKQYIDLNCKYTFYFDADTIFEYVPEYDWEEMINDLENDKILITKHPFYAMLETDVWVDTLKNDLISNLMTENLTERNEISSAYIGDEIYTYVNSAFFAAKNQNMIHLCDSIDSMEQYDLRRYFMPLNKNTYHIPQFIDENYFNRLVNDCLKGISHYKISLKQYNKLYGYKITSPTIFISQKNMLDFKKNRR